MDTLIALHFLALLAVGVGFFAYEAIAAVRNITKGE